MKWEHFQPSRLGITSIRKHAEVIDCSYEVGAITTGRQRVFHRHYVKVIAPDGHEFVGTSEHSVRAALLNADRLLAERGLMVWVAGTHPEFYESGLSANTGYGYLPTVDHAVHMMDAPPTDMGIKRNRIKPGWIYETPDTNPSRPL